ncbi:addiction module antidote protein, HigA family [Cohaesibacter marisflavi]|uniref:Addiction module antidote protein, HigA family n=1 Tax=Cohaesibacter marisflavi TaxID=655353 RepID=A0A1I5MJV1_9HYPH|nr:HigA family addiction module antitoxin [Cohaesibacter marisflavi]SFP09875.1 addiction module antidote protein, HigA family [Cohaesibacter marisflavi]
MPKSSKIPADHLPNPHPGEVLLEEFLKPMKLSRDDLARAVHAPCSQIDEIVLGKRAISADMDRRFTRYFGLSEGFFLGLQSDYDLLELRRDAVK